MAAKTIGVISIKGGVGKTTATSNIAAALANQFNKKVLLVDGNFSAPNVGIHFGIVNPKLTLHEVLTKNQKISEAICDSGHGFDIIAGRLNYKGKVGYMKLKNELSKLKDKYDYIIIDSSPNLNDEMLATMMASSILFVVTTPDYPTLSCTMHAIRLAKKKKTPIAGLILNRVYDKDFELNIEEIEKTAESPVLAVIPHDIDVLEALSNTTPHHSYVPGADGAVEYNKLASMICKEKYDDPRFLSKLKGLFSKSETIQDKNRKKFEK